MHITLPARAPRISLLSRLWSARRLYRERQALLALDQHLLDDIGLTRPDVLAEAARPVWDAPHGWRS